MNQPKELRFRSLEEAEDELANLQNASPKIDIDGQWKLPVILDHSSARNCISTICSPSPLQGSQRLPSALKLKCLGWNPRILESCCLAKSSRM